MEFRLRTVNVSVFGIAFALFPALSFFRVKICEHSGSGAQLIICRSKASSAEKVTSKPDVVDIASAKMLEYARLHWDDRVTADDPEVIIKLILVSPLRKCPKRSNSFGFFAFQKLFCRDNSTM